MEFIYTTSYHHLGLRMANNMENIINMMNKGYDDLSKLQAEALVGSSGTYNFTWHSSLLGPTICFTIITYLYLNPDSTFSGLMLMKWRTRWRRSQRPMLLSTTFCSVQGWDSDMQQNEVSFLPPKMLYYNKKKERLILRYPYIYIYAWYPHSSASLIPWKWKINLKTYWS